MAYASADDVYKAFVEKKVGNAQITPVHLRGAFDAGVAHGQGGGSSPKNITISPTIQDLGLNK